MGNLIIKRIKYSGKKYFFKSEELKKGINIIVGDNGSGKSTFSYFLEFGLGGNIEQFKREQKGKKKNNSNYTQITEDINNFVELEIEINGSIYKLKRFIDTNDIFVNDGETTKEYPIYRQSSYSNETFSDWLLKKLNINVFELAIGTMSWKIGFNDLFRLLNHDQESDPRKIFKTPSVENLVTESSVVRKSIFETLIGIASEEYNIKFNAFKNAQKEKEQSNSLLENFIKRNPNIFSENIEQNNNALDEYEEQLNKLIRERGSYQKQHTNSFAKTEQLNRIQLELIQMELDISEETIRKKNYEIEKEKVGKLLVNLNDEIIQIEKIVFTNDKLDLFSLEVCPFCMSEVKHKKGICICGSQINDKEYEKFVYNSNEYNKILGHKRKSLESIKIAFKSYEKDLNELQKSIAEKEKRSVNLKKDLRKIIDEIEFSGNSELVNKFDDKILEAKESIFNCKNKLKLLQEKSKLESEYTKKTDEFKKKKTEFNTEAIKFSKNNKETIEAFNEIFANLLRKSSCKSNFAEINDDYMPYIDRGAYRERSTIVPIRLMYYFTLLSLGLKRDSVKHPRFLLIDTPERAGIDESNLKLNLKILDDALELSKSTDNETIKNFQVILTTGEDRYPVEYERYIKQRFCKAQGKYILTEK